MKPNKRKNRSLKKHIQVPIMLVMILVTVVIFYRGIHFQDWMTILQLSHLPYLLIALVMMLVFWGLESLMLGIIIDDIEPRRSLKSLLALSVKTTLVGQYYSNITPFASGGQPAQLMIFNRHRISSSNGVAILVSKSLLFQVTVTLYALMLFTLHFNYLWLQLATMKVLLMAGLGINIVGLSLIMIVAFNPMWLKWFGQKIGYLWQRIRKGKSNHINENINHFIDNYHLAIDKLRQNHVKTFLLFVFSILQITAYFSVSFFIYKALGLKGDSISLIITLQSVLYVCVSFIPIPGTIGASEVSFIAIMSPVFTQNAVGVAMMIWRMVSYYFGLLFCGLFTFLDHVKVKRSRNIFEEG